MFPMYTRHPTTEEMTLVQAVAMRECLRKAFTGLFFDIRGIVDACRVAGRRTHVRAQDQNPEGAEDWAVLEALHCVHWINLSRPEQRAVIDVCARVLGVSEIGWEQVTLGDHKSLTTST